MRTKNENLKNSFFLMLICLFAVIQIFASPTQAYADDLYALFGKESYRTYQTIDEISSRILNICNKHQFKYFAILSKWEAYPVSEQEQIEDVEEYVDMAKKDLQFILEYDDTEIGELFGKQFKKYENELENVKKNPNLFLDNKVIFFNYAMNAQDLAMWYDYYTLFKNNTIVPFTNQYIYTNSTRISVNKVREGKDAEKKEGINELKELISVLEEYRKSDNTPNILKGYCKELINHFNRVIDGKPSDLSALVKGDRYWVEGLIGVGQEFDKIQEYNFYTLKFNNFADFPTLDIAKKVKAKDLNNFITMLQSVPTSSAEVIDLKKKHYDLIYALANEKSKGELPISLDDTYVDFVRYFDYMARYVARVQQQYGINFSSSNVVKEIETFKSKLTCLDTQIDEFYTSVAYKPIHVEDTTEYRNLAIKEPTNWGKIVPFLLIGIFLAIVGFIGYKTVKNLNRGNDEDEYYDQYY